MKQILQQLKDGKTTVTEVPVPVVAPGSLLIETRCSLISSGTERMLVEFGKANLLQKALQQPDKVRQVIDKVRTDGLLPTFDVVRNKLDTPLPLGYCNVGVITETGRGITDFSVGDRVISNGKHAEYVCVGKNLCARIPDNVSDEEASFTVLGAIALQGIRLLQPTLGETIVVIGLGLVGLAAVQLLRANGCQVVGLDFDKTKLELAEKLGAAVIDLSQEQHPVEVARRLTRNSGVDGVLITASTASNDPIRQAAQMCRKRGRIVLVGVVGLELSRAEFYEKELSFQVSCSYGPGRYDPDYEERGQDYPLGFVRWTEQRNFEAVLALMADRKLDFAPLVSHRFPIQDAQSAYELVAANGGLAILLEYPTEKAASARLKTIDITGYQASGHAPSLGFIGAGNYATSMLIPAFTATGANLAAVASATGISAAHAARKFSIGTAGTDSGALLSDRAIDAVVISTRHDSHARLVCEALSAGKHVFVEKPLATSREQLAEIARTHAAVNGRLLMVGFNRRYAPQVAAIKEVLLASDSQKSFVMTVNAGQLPAEHWLQNPLSGGRIVGEACHFVDLLRHLAGHPIAGVRATALGGQSRRDTVTITLQFADGSMGTVHYFANGSKAVPKERLEVFFGGAVIQLDNYRYLRGHHCPPLKPSRLLRQDKGQRQCALAFAEAVRTGDASRLIPFAELLEVAETCLAITDQVGF